MNFSYLNLYHLIVYLAATLHVSPISNFLLEVGHCAWPPVLPDILLHKVMFLARQVVVCNLYPFVETVSKEDVCTADAVEEIDIGGVALLRAAAKNYSRVLVLCDPADYKGVLASLQDGKTMPALARFVGKIDASQDIFIGGVLLHK